MLKIVKVCAQTTKVFLSMAKTLIYCNKEVKSNTQGIKNTRFKRRHVYVNIV